MINWLMWLICLPLYYGIVIPVRFAVKTVKVVFLLTCCATGAYIVGCFLYGLHMGLTGH